LKQLKPTIITNINKYIYSSFLIRQKYLDKEYCGSVLNIESDEKHEKFIQQIQKLLNALNKYEKI
jgi:hypothetical protein